MENMCAIAVDIDALNIFGVDIAGNVVALIDHQAAFACLGSLLCKHCAKQTSADDQVIILFHGKNLSLSFSSAPLFFWDAQ